MASPRSSRKPHRAARSPSADPGCAGGWTGFAAASVQLTLEASVVLPLRIARLAGGGESGAREARLMVEEKVEAFGVAWTALGSGEFGASAGEIANGTMRHYLAYVRANRRRLLGGE
jgi:hypothetical protein